MFKFVTLAIAAALLPAAFAAPTDTLAARAGGPTVYNIHPSSSPNKCVGVVGGNYANGAQVDIYDCNGSNAQNWQWYGNQLASVSVQTLEHWCLDAGNVDEIADGVKMKIWQCFDNLPQQTWNHTETTGPIALSVDNKCLDLTDGSTANRNVLQVWDCSAGNPNQLWSFTAA